MSTETPKGDQDGRHEPQGTGFGHAPTYDQTGATDQRVWGAPAVADRQGSEGQTATFTQPGPYEPGPHGQSAAYGEATPQGAGFGQPPHGGAFPGQGQVAPQGQPFGTSNWWTLRRKVMAVGAAAALAFGAGGMGALGAAALTGNETVYGSPTAVSGASTKLGSTAQVAAAVQPSVVSITAQSGMGAGTGSGVVLRSDGVIMTNAHVVQGADQVSVKFSDGKTAPAQVLGRAPSSDIAVIKARGVSGLKPITLGDSSALAVGDPVLAIGSPLGLDGSVTSGIVSALGRQIQEGSDEEQLPPGLRGQLTEQQSTVIKNAIQTDAAINPGNSGGALVNAAGQLVGVNTAIATSGSSSGNIGVGFAIPINDAKKAADKIIKGAQL
ncbi:S1C family serine protease [Actinomadura rudentiformis]|uniref:Trypsin-like serine protease n=1 Tax=Actinomadura rudentiformis TaxID=359158 RepID=A0A6H9Z021_9ACTN|nr:trypsin-like peptidase domain-containing protein [Actinomadura rudentiformis]KAB2347786.1 trypsin-like serine protease [Actinomadura rudentiformis]